MGGNKLRSFEDEAYRNSGEITTPVVFTTVRVTLLVHNC